MNFCAQKSLNGKKISVSAFFHCAAALFLVDFKGEASCVALIFSAKWFGKLRLEFHETKINWKLDDERASCEVADARRRSSSTWKRDQQSTSSPPQHRVVTCFSPTTECKFC